MKQQYILKPGTKFERLTVIKPTTLKSNKPGWELKCDCGNITSSSYSRLIHGLKKSCGCLQKEAVIKRNKKGKGRTIYKRFINEWKDLYKYGYDSIEIAAMYGCPKDSVWGVLNRHGNIFRPKEITHRKYSLDHDFFKNIDTEEKAYWLGFIAADGSISKNKGYVAIQLQYLDYNHLEKFNKSIKSNSKIKIRTNKFKQPSPKYKNNKIKYLKSATVVISGKAFCENLINKNITPQKSLNLKPTKINSMQEKHYWRGLIDGDGCLSFYKNGSPSINLVGSKDICEGFQKFVKKEFNFTAPIGKQGKIFTIQYSCKKAYLIIKLLYENSTIYLDRKYERAIKAIDFGVNKYSDPFC